MQEPGVPLITARNSKNKITVQGRCDSITNQDLRLVEVSQAYKLGYRTAVRVSQFDIVVETGRNNSAILCLHFYIGCNWLCFMLI